MMFCRIKSKMLSLVGLLIFSSFLLAQEQVLPKPQILAQYKSLISNAQGQINKMKSMEDEARQRNDMVVVNCIHPKYVTAKRLLDIANKSFNKLQSLKMKGGQNVPLEVINGITRKIKLSSDRIADLFSEAQKCLSVSSGKVVSKVKVIEGGELLPSKEEVKAPELKPPMQVETPPPSGSE